MSRTIRLTQPLFDLNTEQVLLIRRAERMKREGIEPIATLKRVRAVQRRQAAMFKRDMGR